MEKRFTPEELSLIFSHMGAIQLTFGCSKGCPFCGFDAVPGVREYIPYHQLVNLFKKYGEKISHKYFNDGWKRKGPFLYWASEPSDYASKIGLEDKTYQDVHQLAVEYAGYNPGITSKEINDEEWVGYLISQAEKGRAGGTRVSTFGLNLEERNKLRKRVGENIEFALENGADPRKEQSPPKKLGISFVPDPEGKVNKWNMGIGCFDGALLTPRGLYNVLQVPPSEKFPQGQVVMPLEKFSNKNILQAENIKEVLQNCVIQQKIIPQSGNYYTLELTTDNLSLLVRTKDRFYSVVFKGDFFGGGGNGEIESITDVTEKWERD